jgi:hypothetical protein
MNKDFNKPIFTMPSTTIAIPVSESISALLEVMFNTRIGSMGLRLAEDGLTGPQLIVSCILSEKVNDEWDELKHMYSVKQLEDYNKLRQLVYGIIDDYYALEDEKLIRKYEEREAEEMYWEQDGDKVEF